MQHFSAGLPNLAMALADMHLDRGGDDPIFVESQVGGMNDWLQYACCAALHYKPWGKANRVRYAAALGAVRCSQFLASCLPPLPALPAVLLQCSAATEGRDEPAGGAERLQPDGSRGDGSA